MFKFLLLILAFTTLFPENNCCAFQARVVGVRDGNTIRVVCPEYRGLIHVYCTHVFEKDQRFGREAFDFVSSLLYGREVEITPVEKLSKGPINGIVWIDGESLNRKMIAFGLAWMDTPCSRPECREWLPVQQKAQDANVGLWSLSPMEPIENTKIVKIETQCKKCGHIHKFYLKFTKDPRLIAKARKGGYSPLPESDGFTCDCGARINLTGLKKEIKGTLWKQLARQVQGSSLSSSP